jgi:hypothetical protein
MPVYELLLDGHSTGLACAAAARMEERLPLAAFKMAHPLEGGASVVMDCKDEGEARRECARACELVASDLRGLIDQLPGDPHRKERLWPERQPMSMFEATVRPRKNE